MKNNIYIIGVVVILMVGGLAFFAGTKYQGSKQPQFNRQNNQGNRVNFRPVTGEILNADDKFITVKLTDGSSKIVLLSDKTEINEATQTAKTALIAGKKVAVMGTENSDGSVTASNISLNPQIRQ